MADEEELLDYDEDELLGGKTLLMMVPTAPITLHLQFRQLLQKMAELLLRPRRLRLLHQRGHVLVLPHFLGQCSCMHEFVILKAVLLLKLQ